MRYAALIWVKGVFSGFMVYWSDLNIDDGFWDLVPVCELCIGFKRVFEEMGSFGDMISIGTLVEILIGIILKID